MIHSVDTLFGVLGRIESVRTETLGADGNLRFESRDWQSTTTQAMSNPANREQTDNAETGNEDPSIEFVVADITGVKPGE